MNDKEKIEIPFGAYDSELKGWEYTIPEGMEAEIKDGKVIIKQKESNDERIKKSILNKMEASRKFSNYYSDEEVAWVKKQKNLFNSGTGLYYYDDGKVTYISNPAIEKTLGFQYTYYEPPCFHGGICTNPFRDCINCPRIGGVIGTSTTSGTYKKD